MRWEEAGDRLRGAAGYASRGYQRQEGESEDRVKRIKEFAAELKEAKECGVKYFVVVYFVPEHEKNKLEELRAEFLKEAPFDLVVLTREEFELLAKRLREWGVPGCV